MARSIDASLAQARGLAPGAAAAPAKAATVAGVVTLAPALAARVQPGDTLFIYARAPEGSRMPLAILRKPVAAWPVAFTLDDTLAMSPQARLSGATRVVVEARISRAGSANAAPGDLRGTSGPVDVGRADVRIEIGAVVD